MTRTYPSGHARGTSGSPSRTGRSTSSRDSVTIGRDESNDLTFSSATVSREHAAVTFTDGRWYVEDRGSFNGTYLNGTGSNRERRSRCGTPTGSESARRRSSSPGRRSCRTRIRPSRSKRSRPRIPRSSPRSSARWCSPCAGRGSPARASRACRRTSRSPRNSARRAQPEPSKPHYGDLCKGRASRISPHTRSVAHSVASHASAAGSRKRRGSTRLPRDPSVRTAKR